MVSTKCVLCYHLTILFYQKCHVKYVRTYVHWYCCRNAFPVLNKASSTYIILIDFQKFIHLPAFHLLNSQPAVKPRCTRCRALKITLNNRLLRLIYKTADRKTVFLFYMISSSFHLMLSSLSTGM